MVKIKRSKQIRYALFEYTTRNIGDEIQSVAARQFLPGVDYYINRDKVGDWVDPSDKGGVKLIANAWYMGEPMKWPASANSLDILPVSMHVNSADRRTDEVFSSKKSIEYLQSFDRVGARDKSTLDYFKGQGIDAYFSGCLTLTLQRDASIESRGFVLCVTVSDAVYEAVRKYTDRLVIRIDTTTFNQKLPTEERMKLAEQFLFLYQSSHLVITTRLHAALPSLALEVPVVYITDTGAANYDPSRLTGLMELTNHTTEGEFLEGVENFDFNAPPENPVDYINYRQNLEDRVQEFTGNKKAGTFAVYNDFSRFRLEESELFKTVIMNYDHESERRSVQIFDDLHYDNQRMKDELSQLNTIRISARKLLGNIKRKVNL